MGEFLKGQSWVTTICGVLFILSGLGTMYLNSDGDQTAAMDMISDGLKLLMTISAGTGLMAARDNKKSSQDVGARPK